MEHKFASITITVPKSFDELTLSQYLDYLVLAVGFDKGLDLTSPRAQLSNMRLIEILCGITEEELDSISIDEYLKLNKSVDELIKSCNGQPNFAKRADHFKLEGVDYVVRDVEQLKKMDLGEYTSIQTLKDLKMDYKESISKQLAVLVRPGRPIIDPEVGKRWVIDPFQRRDIDNLNHRAHLFKTKALAKDIYPVLDFFLSLKEQYQ
jgi:hypothetical protein